MNKLLIALDMDGTLLNDKKKISFRTRKYLQKLQKQGHIIALASGRPSRALFPYYNKLKLNSPLICYNGAYVFDPHDDTFKGECLKFPREIIKDLYLTLKETSINNIMCENDTDIWLDKKDLYLAKFFWYEGTNMHYGELDKTLQNDPMTLIIQLKSLENQKNVIDAIKKYPELGVRFWGTSPYCEIHFKKINKGAGVNYIANQYHIKKDNIIVFGDEDNDVDLFPSGGISVAMKNSHDDIKKYANMVSLKDNNHDGVYYTLKKIIKSFKD